MTSAQTANLFSTSLAWHDQSSVFNTGQLDLSPNSVQSDFQPKSYPSFVQSSLADRCLSSFYRNFHAVHPFALPEQFLLRLVPEASIDLLLSSMRWVGSLYINMPSGTRVGLLEDAHTKISHTITPRDGFLVQAMIMLLVSLDGLCEFDKASKMLHDARQLAVEIGLHTRSFAALHGQSVPVLEESWRRTWWDLYVIDGMIAGLHRATNFALNDVQADAALPCEEWQYISGVTLAFPGGFVSSNSWA